MESGHVPWVTVHSLPPGCGRQCRVRPQAVETVQSQTTGCGRQCRVRLQAVGDSAEQTTGCGCERRCRVRLQAMAVGDSAESVYKPWVTVHSLPPGCGRQCIVRLQVVRDSVESDYRLWLWETVQSQTTGWGWWCRVRLQALGDSAESGVRLWARVQRKTPGNGRHRRDRQHVILEERTNGLLCRMHQMPWIISKASQLYMCTVPVRNNFYGLICLQKSWRN
jgi:hypothetical protein